jgi:hypothetical protein
MPETNESSTSRPDISIVLIHFRMQELLFRCLDSIVKKNWLSSYEIIVVHKGSGDDTAALLRVIYPRVIVLPCEQFGIARSRNIGIRTARGRHLLMLDIDTLVLDEALDRLVAFMDRRPACGAAGAKLLDPDMSVQYSCRRFYTLSAVLYRRTPLARLFPRAQALRDHLMMDFDHAREREIDWMQGACFLMRREAVENVGLFDERYVFGFEDVDWCFRAKRKGWKVHYIPDARVIHDYRRSSARPFSINAFRHLKSGLYFWAKHHVLGREP